MCRKPAGTAQATVTQEERTIQPQALSDNPQDTTAAAAKMASSVELGTSGSSSGSGQGPKGSSPVHSGSPVRRDAVLPAQDSPSLRKKAISLQGKESAQTAQDVSLQGKESAQDASHQAKESAQTAQDVSLQGKESAQTAQEGKESAQTAQDVSLQGKESAQTAQDVSLQGKESAQTAQDASLQTAQIVPEDGSPQGKESAQTAQGSPYQVTGCEQKPSGDVASVKGNEPVPSAADRGVEAGPLQKEECDYVNSSSGAVSTLLHKDSVDAAVEVPCPTTRATGAPASASTSSPTKPSSEGDAAATGTETISTSKKDTSPTPDSARVDTTPARQSTPSASEVGLSPLEQDATASDSVCASVGEATPSASTPVKQSSARALSDSTSALDLDKTILASEDPFVGDDVEERTSAQHVTDICQGIEEGGVCMDINATVTSTEVGPAPGVSLERSDNVGSKEVVSANTPSDGPVPGWDESHEKCASPSDDVRFLNVRVSNKTNQKYTYMPVTIGYSLPRHLQYRRSFVRTGFCFAIPDSRYILCAEEELGGKGGCLMLGLPYWGGGVC